MGKSSPTYVGPGENIFLFMPNIIGFARVVLVIVAFYYMPTAPATCGFCYLFSQFLDALDGHAARHWGQCTDFGAVLDMVTDRCATTMLMLGLSVLFRDTAFWFQMLVGLDIASHWFQMTATYTAGKASHKTIDLTQNVFLRLYYTNRKVLFFVCAGNEWLWSMLYVAYFTQTGFWNQEGSEWKAPLGGADVWEAMTDDSLWPYQMPGTEITLGAMQWVAWFCVPVAVFKNVVNVIQLVTACIDITHCDLKKRADDRVAAGAAAAAGPQGKARSRSPSKQR